MYYWIIFSFLFLLNKWIWSVRNELEIIIKCPSLYFTIVINCTVFLLCYPGFYFFVYCHINLYRNLMRKHPCWTRLAVLFIPWLGAHESSYLSQRLLLKISGLLISSLFLYSQSFGWYVLRPYSCVLCWTHVRQGHRGLGVLFESDSVWNYLDGLVWFPGFLCISTFVGYLTPNPFFM